MMGLGEALDGVHHPWMERPGVVLSKCMCLPVKNEDSGLSLLPVLEPRRNAHTGPCKSTPTPQTTHSSTASTTQASQPQQAMSPCAGESKGKSTRRGVDLSPIHSFNKYLLSDYPPGMECHPAPTPSLCDG